MVTINLYERSVFVLSSYTYHRTLLWVMLTVNPNSSRYEISNVIALLDLWAVTALLIPFSFFLILLLVLKNHSLGFPPLSLDILSHYLIPPPPLCPDFLTFDYFKAQSFVHSVITYILVVWPLNKYPLSPSSTEWLHTFLWFSTQKVSVEFFAHWVITYIPMVLSIIYVPVPPKCVPPTKITFRNSKLIILYVTAPSTLPLNIQ